MDNARSPAGPAFELRGILAARPSVSVLNGIKRGDAQLYVNRGIGTITFPIRIGARPEITVFELARGA